MGLSFGAKIRAIIVGLCAALIVLTLFLVNRAATGAATDRVSGSFEAALITFDEAVRSRLDAFERLVEATLSDHVFRGQLGRTRFGDDDFGLGGFDDDAGTGTAEAHEVFSSVDLPLFRDYPLLAIVDADGVLLFTQADREAFGEELADLPLIGGALRGETVVALSWTRDERLRTARLVADDAEGALYLTMARPIVAGGALLGAMIAGEPVATLRPQLERAVGAHLILVDEAGGHRDASEEARAIVTAGRDHVPELLVSADSPVAVELGGEVHLALAAPLSHGDQVIGRALLLTSLDAELAPFRRALNGVVIAGALLAILASVVLGGAVSRWLTRPLHALEDGARRVQGGDLNARVPVTSRDEVGRLALAFNEMTDGLRQRDQIKATFKRYLDPAVVEELIRHPDKVNLGGETRRLTILFSDLVGFTSLSEGRDAADLVTLLNEYFDAVVQPIAAESGTVDKFAGDSVMCFFGAPLPQADHGARAIRAALGHLEAVDALKTEWARLGRPQVDCRIGVSTGEVVVGNIGSKEAQGFTVIGDPVNLAARLESANKAYGTRLMVSEATLEGNEAMVEHRELDLLRVKGKRRGVRVFEILARKGELDEARVRLLEVWARARTAYLARDFEAAGEAFLECLEIVPGDGPSLVMVRRCTEYLTTPPPSGWDGVYEMQSK